MTREPILALPDFGKPYEVRTDASDYVIGEVLMQDGQPIAFESRKLNETERSYTVQEKEMTVVVELKTPAGLLQPLPVPERPWESLSMDFIIGLPKSESFGSILVVVDRFSKYATFISVTNECPAEEAARLFLRHVRSGATNQSPFEIVTGQQPLTPNAVVTHCTRPNPAAYRFAKYWQEKNDLARACLHKANKCSKKWAGKKRMDVQFQVGDSVLAKLHLILRYTGLHKGLVRRYEGPFKVVKRVGKVAYKLELPAKLKVYPAFHISMLKPFHGDQEDPN
ncbi:uncharacterized protein LOC105778935 [Gossypium raimondii]|uniref:uncharacterized protein LOC105778935 n=1 Tax=Gossypium raimondii TaxID=29730 RepID=UPI00063AA1B8|nr:uncharacterized protein LOC105778935 [Gossypium raimondii]